MELSKLPYIIFIALALICLASSLIVLIYGIIRIKKKEKPAKPLIVTSVILLVISFILYYLSAYLNVRWV